MSSIPNSPRRILYVEDEPSIAEVLQIALQVTCGIDVVVCESGADALHLAPVLRPDLILLDMMLPEMDGRAVLRALRERPDTARVPVIFVTAKVQAHEVGEYEGTGAIGVIAKPFDPLTIGDTLIGMWRGAGA